MRGNAINLVVGKKWDYSGVIVPNSSSIHSAISSLTLRYPSRIVSSLPGIRWGSEKPWWMVFFAPDTIGQIGMGIVAERDCEIE